MSDSPRPHWPELDVLRGLAAVLMVTNHAGVRWPRGEGDLLGDAVVFAGSLAPVVFFLVTGLGRGVQGAAGARRPLADTVRKAVLLVLADAALWIAPGRLVGLDFLGFIGLSSLLVEVIARARRPQLVALLALVAVLAARLVVAPLLRGALGAGPLLFVLGDQGIAGFSYPPCPWLAFPILGYLLGSAAQRHGPNVQARRAAVALACGGAGIVLGGACVSLAARSAPFFRWGTVSFAFTVLAFAAVAASLALVLVLGRSPRMVRAFALPGTSSLVVVPVHYALIEMGLRLPLGAWLGAYFVLAAAALAGIALALARRIEAALVGLVRGHTTPVTPWLLLASAAALLRATYASEGTPIRLPCMVAAQLVLCAMFALRAAPTAARPVIAWPART